MNFLKRLFSPPSRPSSPAVKAPVKVTVTARKVLADGTLGEALPLDNLRISVTKES